MAQQNINLGADGSGSGGDSARTAFEKTQENFNELYQRNAQLGTAANKNAQSSTTDTTPGALMVLGAGGLMSPSTGVDIDPDSLAYSCFFRAYNSASMPSLSTFVGIHLSRDSATGRAAQTVFSDATNGVWTRFRYASGAWGVAFQYLTTANAASLPITSALAASADNDRTLGTAALRWSTVYAGTGTINTSDAREKTEVRALTDGEIAAARQLAQEIGAYKFLAAVAEKDTAAREHIGLTVQRAIEILQAHGLDPFNYGFICYDSWTQVTVDHPATYEQVPVTDADGNVIGYENGAVIKEAWTEVTQEAGDRYSFRTDELSLFIARGQAAYLAQLEARIAALEPAA